MKFQNYNKLYGGIIVSKQKLCYIGSGHREEKSELSKKLIH